MIQIVFDFDGVLVRSQSRSLKGGFFWSSEIEKDLAIPFAVVKELFQSSLWTQITAGSGNFEDHIRAIFLKHHLSLQPSVFIQYWLSKDLNWNVEIFDLAKSLKEAGHELFIATNQDRLRGKLIRSQPEIQALFKDVFISADLGVCKPNLKFFEKVRHQLSQKLIFIDDDERNVISAQADGWQGIHFNPDLQNHTVHQLKTSLLSVL